MAVKDSLARAWAKACSETQARQLSLVAQMGKELIEFGLNTLAHATEQQRNQGGQGQLALASEGTGVIGMGCVQEKFARAQARDKSLSPGHPMLRVC